MMYVVGGMGVGVVIRGKSEGLIRKVIPSDAGVARVASGLIERGKVMPREVGVAKVNARPVGRHGVMSMGVVEWVAESAKDR